jgi:hypothetical protein
MLKMRPIVVGCLTFISCFVLGFFVTAIIRDRALHDLPRTEIYEAMYHDELAVEWTCSGWTVSLVISLLTAGAAAWVSRVRQP